MPTDSEAISLNVGGTHELTTLMSLLKSEKGSYLDKYFSGLHK